MFPSLNYADKLTYLFMHIIFAKVCIRKMQITM
jgi:hypothetical protein